MNIAFLINDYKMMHNVLCLYHLLSKKTFPRIVLQAALSYTILIMFPVNADKCILISI